MADLELPWFKFFVRDWLADQDVRLLNWAEKGLLIELMASFWMKGSLPADPSTLARLVNMDEDRFREMWRSVEGFFEEVEEGSLVHRDLGPMRTELLDQRRKQREAGRKGAEKRWRHHDQDGDASGDPNSDPMPTTEGRPKTADAAHLGGSGDHGDTEGAKGTKDRGPCPSCDEKWISADSERCSQCATASSDGGSEGELSDLPF